MQQAAPIRGTQSFVGVMSEIWHRPWLTFFELLWRAVAFAPMLLLLGFGLGALGIDVRWNTAPLAGISIFQPDQALAALTTFFSALSAFAGTKFLIALSVFLLFWTAIASLGRAVILRCLEPALTARRLTLWMLNLLRVLAAVAALGAWVFTSGFAIHHFAWTPILAGRDPNIIAAFACIVTGALVFFVLWCMVGWALFAAPIVSMGHNLGVLAAFRAALRNKPLRAKLVEINLVMGIVRVCLLVLAMVFSACPLPFASVETQSFLHWWWLGVSLWYLIASDFFHVVRAAVCLRLFQAYDAEA